MPRSWGVRHHLRPERLEWLNQFGWHATTGDRPLYAHSLRNPRIEEAGLDSLRLLGLRADSGNLAHVEGTLLGRRAAPGLGLVHEDANFRHGKRLNPHLQAV